MEKRDKKYVGRLERVLFKRVTLQPLDIHPLSTSQPLLNLFDNTILNTLCLITAPSGRPRYFKGNQDASQSIHIIHTTHSNQNKLSQITFKLETASEHKNNTRR
jgi:hypothetical protein